MPIESGDDMPRSFLKRVLIYLMVIIFVGFTTMIAGIYKMVDSTKAETVTAYNKTQHGIVDNVFNREREQLEKLIVDYAVWDDLYYGVEENRIEWSRENATEFLVKGNEGFKVDLVYTFGTHNDYEELYGATDILPNVKKSSAYKKTIQDNSVNVDFIVIGEKLYLLAVSPITTNNKRMTNGYYVMARAYSDETVENMVSRYSNDDEFIGLSLKNAGNKYKATAIDYVLKNIDQLELKEYQFYYNLSNYYRPYSKIINHSIAVTALLIVAISTTLIYFRGKIYKGKDEIKNSILNLREGNYSEISIESNFDETDEVIAVLNDLAATLKKKKKKSIERHMDTLIVIIEAIEEKDPYLFGHSRRVMEIASLIGQELKIKDQKLLEESALLHDIGKVGLPSEILNKPGVLSFEEYSQVKSHVKRGEWIVSGIPYLKKVGEIIRQHHERYDGKGYPDRLVGEEIDLVARIITLADSFEAMTSDRPHRGKYDFYQAVSLVKKEKDLQFDGVVVEAFLERIQDIHAIVLDEQNYFKKIGPDNKIR